MKSFIEYLKSTKAELTHVTFPTREKTIMFTLAIVLISLVAAYLLGFFDYLFSLGLSKLLEIV